jgi:TatD DNase family protein
MGPTSFIDIHTHSKEREEVISLLNIFFEEFDTRHADNYGYFSLGLHPWHINRQKLNDEQIKSVFNRASSFPGFLAIGEAGLDKGVEISFKQQLFYFEQQAFLAHCLKKPLIIHCVRAFQELLLVRKNLKISSPWIIHGFNGSIQLAGQLMDAGCILSFGKALFRDNSKAAKCVRHICENGFFLETDDSAITIGQVYQRASLLTGLPQEVLKENIFYLFINTFNFSDDQ